MTARGDKRTRVELDRILSASFGLGGYQDVQIGISFTLGGESWGVSDFWGYWTGDPGDEAKWTLLDRTHSLGGTVMRISSLLADSKKNTVADLKDVPVEVMFEGVTLKSWRVLTEVIQ